MQIINNLIIIMVIINRIVRVIEMIMSVTKILSREKKEFKYARTGGRIDTLN